MKYCCRAVAEGERAIKKPPLLPNGFSVEGKGGKGFFLKSYQSGNIFANFREENFLKIKVLELNKCSKIPRYEK